jgi:hypothetical protein
MKQFISIILVITASFVMSCSESFLDFTPKGKVTDEQLNNPEKVEQLCTAAYASLGNDEWAVPFTHMWVWGSVRGGDAYKGGGSVSDQGQYDQLEKFNLVTVDLGRLDEIWVAVYQGIARANDAMQRLNNLTVEEFPNKTQRLAEMRFIRGHFHFLMKIIFKYIPYIDETISQNDRALVGNSELTNIELWDKIAADFQFAADNLPPAQLQVGRPNQVAAWAYLAKVRLYEAYEQDEDNQVISINTARLNEVVDLCDDVIGSGKYSLVSDFGNNFLYPLSENNSESIFAIQYSVNDGTTDGRINKASSLNYNMAAPYGCCSFHAPSQELVNAFRTDPATGLPLFDTYNATVMRDSIDFWTNGVDPRLDHTIGVPTHPFKYDPTFIAKKSWQRVPEVYGQYTPMKEIAHYKCPCFKKVGPFFGSSTNWTILRYDDVLLMKAEALIELGREAEALPVINEVRNRAANSTAMLKYSNGDPVANYNVQPYIDGVNCTWTQDYARQAMRWERRVEFAMEGPHFFDLVRWGIAAEVINAYFEIEKTRIPNLASAQFTLGRDEYLPIPQNQITLTNGLYVQNANW